MSEARVFQISEKRNGIPNGVSDWNDILVPETDTKDYFWPSFDGDMSDETIATLNFSSGTTGLPKGVAISHHNIIANLEQCSFITRLGRPDTPDDRWVGFLPMYHAYGQLYYCLMCARFNIPVYVMIKFEFSDLLRNIQDYRVTSLQIAPRK